MQREQDARRYIEALSEKPRFKNIAATALRRLVQIDSAEDLRDLASPANQLTALDGAGRGRYCVRIDKHYRICFRWKDGHPFDVEITDE
jgi:proteic killer suppression protein